MFGTQVQRRARSIAEQIVRPVAALRVSPNAISFVGLALNGVAALVIALGPLRWGGALVLFSGVFDLFDGAVARVQQKSSRFGAFLDSTLDRYAEGMLFLGIIIHATRVEHAGGTLTTVLALAYCAAILSLIVSYTRARAEGLGMECKVGIMERPERVLLLGIGLLIGNETGLLWMLVAFVVLTGFTGLQRIFHVWRTNATAANAATHGGTAPNAAGSAPKPTARRVP
jgi:CDP-diacylglycerol---glycerol-3-phosphate 3-phosphatidyltransferase